MGQKRGPSWYYRRVWASAAAAALGLVGCSGLDVAPPMPSALAPPGPTEEACAACSVIQTSFPAEAKAQPANEVAITLDAVFRLAEAQSPRIAQAREKLNESLIVQEMNQRCWLPNTYAGLAYYRHEGGIQQENGVQLHSSTGAFVPGLNVQGELDLRESTFRQLNDQRLIWQDRAELTKIDNEVLLEAATTYVDFLTARRGLAIAEQIEKSERKLLERAEKLAKSEAGATAFRESMRSVLAGRGHTIAKVRQQADAAMAKLVYLLGLRPGTVLVPQDLTVAPFELVDVSPPTEVLVSRAMETGPGVRELGGILNVIQTGLEKSYGAHNLLPTLGFTLFEGMLGSGPGGSTTWDNRLDIGVNVRWNLAELTKTEHNRRRARSRMAQTMFAMQELRAKLALGVREGKDAVLHGREQIGLASSQVKHANESYRLSNERMEKGAKGANPLEVLLSVRSLEQAHFNRLMSIASHNKAQVRLVMLLGAPTKLAPPAPVVVGQPPALLPAPHEEN